MRATDDLSAGFVWMFRAAFQSRSAFNPHAVQWYVRCDSGRVVLTARQPLHVFQKKATRGIATPQPEIDLIKGRLRSGGATPPRELWRGGG